MTDERTYLLVPADAATPISTGRARIELDEIKALIGGGWLEAVSGDTFTCYIDEEGKIKGQPYNMRATVLLARLGRPLGGDIIVGDAVFFGAPDHEGFDTDVPDDVVQTAHLTP